MVARVVFVAPRERHAECTSLAPEGTMAEDTNEPTQEPDDQQANEERRRTRESDPEPPAAIREDIAEDDRFQSTDN
jgi:hypothetical protein